MVSCQYCCRFLAVDFWSAAGQSSCDQKSVDWFHTELHQILAGNVIRNYYTLRTNYKIVNVVSSSWVTVILDRNVIVRLKSN